MFKQLLDKLKRAFNEEEYDEGGSDTIPALTLLPSEIRHSPIAISSAEENFSILVVTDAHGKLMQENIEDALDGECPDIVLMLGDNMYEDIEAIRDCMSKLDIPIVGISGNHDDTNLLSELGITNIHMNTVQFKGVKISGFGGSIKYKDDSSKLLFTNEQSEVMLSDFPPCDIFITHDKPCFEKHLNENSIHSHSGLTGIARYIENNRPELHLHGHLHECYVKKHSGGTMVRCCYGAELIKIKRS